ncbi:hypothetical protein J1N35_028507 [Gossypium stocksii]|uniref:Uncharacterized protein n=1 Tax=Gossypium stocksii TaxID=47602 RepID=A0A9D3ZSN4_9ROSI|nr:hypothetical protein J1N35_028507 [Gossypium stocksii]
MASRTVGKDITTPRGSAAIVSEAFGHAAKSVGHSSHSGNVLEKERVVLLMMSNAINEVLERRGGILAFKQIVRLLRKGDFAVCQGNRVTKKLREKYRQS